MKKVDYITLHQKKFIHEVLHYTSHEKYFNDNNLFVDLYICRFVDYKLFFKKG